MVMLVTTLLCLLGRASGHDLSPSSSDGADEEALDRHVTHPLRLVDDDHAEETDNEGDEAHGKEDREPHRTKRGKVDNETVQQMLRNKLKSKPNRRSDIPVECQQLWMTRADMNGFVQMLQGPPKIDEYLEYGGGGSTLCASRLVRHVTTVEHNHDWCVALEKKLNESSVTNVNLLCHPVDWQSPGLTEKMDGYYRDFQTYVDTVHTLGIKKFDFVFIDGRARAACAKAVWRYLDNDSIMAIHDWKRTHYHDQVLAIYDRVDTPFALKELAVMKKKMVPLTAAELQQKVP